ncbi:zinc finger domain-containing protein [Nonomuraea sp. NPDC050022]
MAIVVLYLIGGHDLRYSRCGTPIRRVPFMKRSSYPCPRCQRRPR